MELSGLLPFTAKHADDLCLNSGKDPVLYLSNPEGMTTDSRRAMLNDLGALNRIKFADYRLTDVHGKLVKDMLA